eukprot:COSAG06_NODE_1482_length_9317_cov_8.315578_15_plen_51_part_00
MKNGLGFVWHDHSINCCGISKPRAQHQPTGRGGMAVRGGKASQAAEKFIW